MNTPEEEPISSEVPEKDLVPAVVALLEHDGYEIVLSGVASSRRFVGNGEFPIVSPSTGRLRYVDVVGARWSGDRLHTVAVECKATADKVYDALGQAVEYQSLFDEVYIATPLKIEDQDLIRSTLVDLGLGHIRTGPSPTIAETTVVPTPRWPARFLPHMRRTSDGRLGLGIAMRAITPSDRDVRYGYFPREIGKPQGMWYAEEVLGHLQWNCTYETSASGSAKATAGINVERVEDVNRICTNVDQAGLTQALVSLDPRYAVRVIYAPSPRPYGVPSTTALDEQASASSAAEILKTLGNRPKKTRPQLELSRTFDTDELRTIHSWPATLSAIRSNLGEVMSALQV